MSEQRAKLYRIDAYRITPPGPRKEILFIAALVVTFFAGFALHALLS